VTAAFRSLTLLAVGLALLPAASPSVDLAIDFPNASPKHFTVPFHSGMTVFDAMKEAESQPGGIHFEYKGGSPATLLLVSMDGVANQGGGPDKRNWTYRVNSILGDRSFGICKIAASAQVSWKFDVFHADQPMKPGACQ
jgi:Domain of unknown function (DUF4430)